MFLSMYWACGVSPVLCVWIVGTCLCDNRHLHDLIGSLLLHSFLQRLDLLLSGCCAIGVCADGQLVKVLSESAFVWDPVRDQTAGSHQHPDRTS